MASKNTEQVAMELVLDAGQWMKAQKKVQKQLSDLAKQTKRLADVNENSAKKEDQLASSTERATRQIAKQSEAIAKNTGSMKDMVGAFGKFGLAVGSIKAVGSAVTGLASAFGEMLDRGFEFNNFLRSAPIDVYKAQRATQGLVTKFDLLKAASAAGAFGLKITSKAFADMSRAAVIASQTMGITTKNAMDSLVTGTARASKQILDNLGIMLNLDTVYRDYAKTLGVTKEQLTDVEQRSAVLGFVQKELARKAAESSLELSGLGGEYQKLKVAWTDAKDAFSSFIAKLESGMGVLKRVTGYMREWSDRLAMATGSPGQQLKAQARHAMKMGQERLKSVRAEIKALKDYNKNWDLTIKERKKLNDLLKKERSIRVSMIGVEVALGDFSAGEKNGKGKGKPGKPRGGRKSSSRKGSKALRKAPISLDQLGSLSKKWQSIAHKHPSFADDPAWYNRYIDGTKSMSYNMGVFSTVKRKLDKIRRDELSLSGKMDKWAERQGLRQAAERGRQEKRDDRRDGPGPSDPVIQGFAEKYGSKFEPIRQFIGTDATASITDSLASNLSKTGDNMTMVGSMAEVASGGLNMLAAGYSSLSDSISDFWASVGAGEADFNTQFKKTFGNYLKMFSKEMQLQAMKHLALGTVALLTNPAAAGGHFAGAAIFQAAAAASGIAGGAMVGTGKAKSKGRGTSSRGLGGRSTGAGAAPGANMTFNINTMLATADENEFARAIGNGVKMAKARGQL